MDSFSSNSHAVPSEIQNPSNGDYYSTRRIVKSNCRTEEVESGKFVRKCEKTEEVLKDCLGKNQYDIDVTTWSPAGRLFQVEYAMEAVKQGSTTIGLRSKTHVVLGGVNKGQSELSSHQHKIFKVDDHIGVAIAGVTTDDHVLSRYIVQLTDKAQCFVRKALKAS